LIALLVRFVLGPLARAVYRPEVHGVENVPATGPVLLAANHRAALDTGVITFATPRQVKFLGKAEYFVGKGLKGKLLAGRSSTPVVSSRSTPRAPAHWTAGCTAATPASRRSPWRPARRWSRWP
jgi:acyltransferase-like protein